MRIANLLLPLTLLLISSCGQDEKSGVNDSIIPKDTVADQPAAGKMDFHAGMQVDAKAFEVTDSTGKKTGEWGYDLYVGPKKVIHQPIMPAMAGLHGFSSEEDAMKIGELAAKRFSSTGSFPTIFITDYDSLNIKYSK
jgi:hypothetical protein